jgi:thioredoxin 1
MTNILRLNEENFENEVLRSPIPVLVDFYGDFCQPCRQMALMIEQLAQEVAGMAKVGKVNVDENPRLAAALRIDALPTILVFRNGRMAERLVGMQSKHRLSEALIQ